MRAQHTPGPWLIESGGKSHKSINSTNGACVADVWRINVSRQEAAANTRLIAAAPELLEMLIQLADYANDFSVSGVYLNEETEGSRLLKNAYATIAKATGEPL